MKLLKSNDPKLREPSAEVTKFNGKLRDLAQEMNRIMSRDKAVGIAAPQIGVLQRVIIVAAKPLVSFNSGAIVMVNPKIIHQIGSIESLEGCLSFPGRLFKVQRPAEVAVYYQDLTGKPHTLVGRDLFAVCTIHEINHLDGVLVSDIGEEIY